MNPKLFNPDKNPAEIKKHLPVNVNTSFDVIAPFLGQCENRYVLPLLGKTLFGKLSQHYASGESNEKYDTVIDYLQFALTRLAYWQGYDIISVSISDAGARTLANKENQLYRYQHENIKTNLKNDGFDSLDMVLNFLYENLTDFAEFALSEFYLQNKSEFIKSTQEFNKIFNINNSHLVFTKMMYYVRIVQDTHLKHRLGGEFISELLAMAADDPKRTRIIDGVCKYIVYKSVSEGISELKKSPTDKGLVFENQDAFGGQGYSTEQVSVKEVTQTQTHYDSVAQRYISAVIELMKQHREDYPLFFKFSGDDPTSNAIFRRDNTDKKTFWT